MAHHSHDHSHVHGAVDPALASSARGIWALKWSFFGLLATALLQLGVVWISGSIALLGDTIHNFSDAATAVPLWVAFRLARRAPTGRFTYGYGRVEDLAGVLIVLIILMSGLVVGYASILRLLHPEPITYLWAVAAAALLGFVGNEAVAIFRIRVGREIGSAALVADGYHARADGLVSLAVLAGAAGVWLGYPAADPLVGLVLTLLIGRLTWQAASAVFIRLLDGVESELLEEATHAARHVAGVREIGEARARWVGHRLALELNVAVDPALTVTDGHAIAKEVRHQVLHHVRHAGLVQVHVDPATEPGEAFHRITSHTHDGLSEHSHS